jgi:ABC-type molybdate transport system permease subunit
MNRMPVHVLILSAQAVFVILVCSIGSSLSLAICFDIALIAMLLGLYFASSMKAKDRRWGTLLLVITALVLHGLALPPVVVGGNH